MIERRQSSNVAVAAGASAGLLLLLVMGEAETDAVAGTTLRTHPLVVAEENRFIFLFLSWRHVIPWEAGRDLRSTHNTQYHTHSYTQ